jgi:hypothetical protein
MEVILSRTHSWCENLLILRLNLFLLGVKKTNWCFSFTKHNSYSLSKSFTCTYLPKKYFI